MIPPRLQTVVEHALGQFPVVAIIGARQTGKTALARMIAGEREASAVYIDLERPSDLVNIGWDEIAMSHALVLVEWPERAGHLIPAGHVAIDLEHTSSDPQRRVLLAG